MTEKVVLGDIISGYNLSLINDNFQKIEDELNNNVLYRDAPEGAPNQLEVDIDANGKRIYNLPKPTSMNEPVRVFDLLNASDVVPVTEWFVDRFIGDGTTTDFILTNDTQSEGSVFVYFNGVAKTLNVDYVVEGNVVSFAPAPAIGVNVVVHYGIFVGSGAGVTSVGSGASIVKDGDGVLRSIQGIGEVSVNVNGDVVEVGTNAQNNIGVSLGTGAPVYAGKTGATLQFKSLKAGTNVTLTESADSITVAATGAGGGGEVNTASNVGTGVGVFKAKGGVDLKFKSLKAGANVTLTPSADEVLIEATGSGGGTSYFANPVDNGAVGDFVPAADGTGTGTANDTAVMAAIATGKPIWLPAGNFYVANWATRYAISRASVIGPGKFWGDTGSGKMELGKSVIVGSTNTHEVSYAGGVLWANAGASGMRTWTGQHNWMITQPDKGPCQVQLYPGCQALAARSISPNILEATYGTYDLNNLYVGDHIGWNGEVWKVASILSTTQITVTTFAGGAPGFVTSAQSYPWYRAYEVGEGLCNTSGTSVVRVSGDAWPAGYSGDHMYAIINGTRYIVSQGPENAGTNKLVLSSSAGTQSNVSIRFFRTYGPWSYVTLFRFQGVAGGVETNGGMALNIKNEFCIWNGGTHNAMYGPLRLNAPKVTIGPGTYGNERTYDRLEVDGEGVCLGGNSYGTPIYNYMKVLGGGTGFAPALAGRGIDANPDFGFDLKGNGTFRFTAGSFGRNVFEVYAPAGTTVWPTVAAGVGKSVFSVNSAATNADIEIAPKGTIGKTVVKQVPFVRLQRAAALGLATSTLIPWDTEVSDIFGMHAINDTKIYAPVAGLYRISAQFQALFYGAAASRSSVGTRIDIKKNGLSTYAALGCLTQHRYESNLVAGSNQVHEVILAAGDYVEIRAIQISNGSGDGSADMDTTGLYTSVTMSLVSGT